ncbi:MAG TPA: hypothetical protein ENN84_01840 [Candidatus Marinimicrobia bacterium]|nr:hypothetical protein [Candidatus Neomarinimicrobiota bacterium]
MAFLSFEALYGGGAFTLKPDGSLFQIPVSVQEYSPFTDFLIPRTILFVVFGIIPILLVWLLIKKSESAFLERLNLFTGYYYGWTYTVYTGFALIIWIAVQTRIFNVVDRLHTIYTFYGIVLALVALLPSGRKL